MRCNRCQSEVTNQSLKPGYLCPVCLEGTLEQEPGCFVLMGKAGEVFNELSQLAKWERYGIGHKIFYIDIVRKN